MKHYNSIKIFFDDIILGTWAIKLSEIHTFVKPKREQLRKLSGRNRFPSTTNFHIPFNDPNLPLLEFFKFGTSPLHTFQDMTVEMYSYPPVKDKQNLLPNNRRQMWTLNHIFRAWKTLVIQPYLSPIEMESGSYPNSLLTNGKRALLGVNGCIPGKTLVQNNNNTSKSIMIVRAFPESKKKRTVLYASHT